MAEHSNHRQVIIVGSGPAGYTAALYTARANLQPLMIGGYTAGGQLMLTSDVENYPGYPKGVQGPEMMQDFREQVERFGAEVLDVDATSVDFSHRPFTVVTDDGTYTAESVIVSTGAAAKWLEVPGEELLRGRGVSACATCDGFFFRDRRIVVIGGGDTALEEALFLTRFASTVHLLHRSETFRASTIMMDRVRANPKIQIHTHTAVTDVLGDKAVTGLALKDSRTGETRELPVSGFFVAIGHEPNTKLFAGWLDMDDAGYLVTAPGTTCTNVDGVFACGDAQDHVYRQAITAAGTGCMAAIDAERFLAERGEIAGTRTETEYHVAPAEDPTDGVAIVDKVEEGAA